MNKYITKQIMIACLTRPAGTKKDIHAQLQETISERKQILDKYIASLSNHTVAGKDIHEQLRETIAERRRIMQLLANALLPARVINMTLPDKKAA